MDYDSMKKELNVCDTDALIKELHRRTGYDLTSLLTCNGCRLLSRPPIERVPCRGCARIRSDYWQADTSSKDEKQGAKGKGA